MHICKYFCAHNYIVEYVDLYGMYETFTVLRNIIYDLCMKQRWFCTKHRNFPLYETLLYETTPPFII